MGTAPVGTLMRAMGLPYGKPRWNIIRGIYTIGLPAIVAQALMSLMTYGINLILVEVSEAMVTAYGLYYKIQQFVLFAAFGLRDAITPIVSFAHGMGSRSRITQGMKYGVGYTLALMAVGMAALLLFARPLCGLFGLSGAWAVWLTFPTAEGLTAAIAAGLLARLYRGKIQPMG